MTRSTAPLMARQDEDDSFESLFPRAPPLANPIYRRRRATVWCSIFAISATTLLGVSYFLGLLDSFRYVATDEVTRSVLNDMDLTSNPCDDFYQYACGGWLRKTSIPPSRSSFSRSFSMDSDEIRGYLRTLLDGELSSDSNSRAGALYASCMKSAYASSVDFQPFEPFASVLVDVDASSPDTIARAIGRLRALGVGTVFGVYMEGDFEDPSVYTLYLGQGGLGLPNRNYYIRDAAEDKKIRQVYKDYLAKLFKEMTTQFTSKHTSLDLGLGHETDAAEFVLATEKQFALAAAPPENLTDPLKTNNRMTPLDRTKILINSTLSGWGLDDDAVDEARLVMDYPPFFSQYSSMLMNGSTSAWRAYFAASVLRTLAGSGRLGSTLKEESFRMTQTLYGTKKMAEKWKFCYGQVNGYAGESLGYEFVSRKFPEAEKAKAGKFVSEIQESFGHLLDKNDWMDQKTTDEARKKMQALSWKIGYGQLDKLDDIELSNTDYAANLAALEAHATAKDLESLRKGSVDREKWYMLPHEVNAYYDPSMNEMVFPAGILQRPFYSGSYPASMNYGGIGAVMGHELSHGFDSSGRKFDEIGKLRDWWSRDSSKAFEKRTKCVEDLYSSFRPDILDENLNGLLTLTENLADMGGIKVAFHAYQSAKGSSDFNIGLHDRFSDDQLFFVSYGQTWCSKYERGALRTLVEGNPHSPGEFRVQGPLSQFQPFADAFNCGEKTTYNPSSKCTVW